VPLVRVVFYQEGDKVLTREWLNKRSDDEQDACYERLEQLRDHGYELSFPLAEHIEDGIWELRARVKKVRLRVLYFFHERQTAVVTHGFQKDTSKVPPIEIKRAKDKRARYRANPESHAFPWEPEHE